MKKIAIVAIVVALVIGAVSCSGAENSSQSKTQETTEKYSEAALKAVPYPLDEMKSGGWLERLNVRERLLRYSDADKLSYVYLFSNQGQLISNYTIKGKVSNAGSQLTTSEVVNDYCGTGECVLGTEAPMDDGTWGATEDAIFFFTTEGVMVQWNGPYVLSDAPLNLTTPPVLVYNTDSQPSSVADAGAYGGK